MSDLKNLRDLTLACIKEGLDWYTADELETAKICSFDHDFVAAFSPIVVLDLLDQLEAAQKDAARYQWLRENRFRVRKATNEGPAHPALEAFEFDHFAKHPHMHTRKGLDFAIDAAMASKS